VLIKPTLGNKIIHDDPYISKINQNSPSLDQIEKKITASLSKIKKCTIDDTRG
jgi:hypothetical protein